LQPNDVEEQVRDGLRALTESVVRIVPIDDISPPGSRALVDEGFTPLEEITGALFLAAAWPSEYRRALPPRNSDDASQLPDGKHWFVRSPWPSIPLDDLFDVVMQTLDDCVRESSGTPEPAQLMQSRIVERVRELLALGEEDLGRRLRP
jgi:hypothetical protein